MTHRTTSLDRTTTLDRTGSSDQADKIHRTGTLHRTGKLHRTAQLAWLGALALALVLAPMLTPSQAFADDSEDAMGNEAFLFGQKLAVEGRRMGRKDYFHYARRVYERILANSKRADDIKDLARFGLAELNSEAAIGAMGRDVPYKNVVRLITEACEALNEFATKYPKHPRANEAKLKVGTTRLGFVQWARDTLLPDSKLMGERDTNEGEVSRDAKTFVVKAIQYFDKLREGHDARTPSQLSQGAQYYWVLSQYYRALVLDPCSEAAIEAFNQAERHLDDFTMMNDGKLLGVFALDILGLNWVEKAKCINDEKEKALAYNQALQSFEACMATPMEGPDHLKVITSGFYHYAQTCRDAGRLAEYDFFRTGVEAVGPMLEIQPLAARTPNGIRALIQLGLLHGDRERTDKAIEALTLAAQKAGQYGHAYLERRANNELRLIMSGSSGGDTGNVDPEVLKRVADSLYSEKRYSEAAAAYKQVVARAPRTEAALKAYVESTWTRISSCYRNMNDMLGAALALEPLHEAWIDGVYATDGTVSDPNFLRLGEYRYSAVGTFRQLAEATDSRVYRERAEAMLKSMKRDYPNHPRTLIGMWSTARTQFSKAAKAKRDKKRDWKTTLAEAERAFRDVTEDAKSMDRHMAWDFLIRSAEMRDAPKDMIKIGNEAMASWASPAVQAQIKEFPLVRSKVHAAQGHVLHWLAEAYVREKNWDAVIKTLDGYHAEHESLKGKPVYYSGTLGHLVLAYIGKDDIESANGYLNRLLKIDPGYFRLPSITKRLANYYNDQAKSLEDELRELVREESTLKVRVRVGLRKEYAMLDARSNLRNRLAQAREAVRLYEAAEDDGSGKRAGVKDKRYEEYKASIPVLEKDEKALQERINAHSKTMSTDTARLAQINERSGTLRSELYEPRSKSAGYFYGLYTALKAAGKAPFPSNVKVFGDLYRKAAKLRPEVRLNWDRARELYEAFVGMKGAKKADVAEVTGYLGAIYYRLATSPKTDGKERQDLIQKARDRLQSAIANEPANVPLLLGQIVGEYGILPWRSDVTGQKHYFALPKGIKSVAEFRQVVAQLGKPASRVPVPQFEREADNTRYAQALQRFQAYIATAVKDSDLTKTVSSFKLPSMDSNFYRLHGNTSVDFRLALAWVYASSGEPEDAARAVALASSVSRGALATDEGNEDWWLARVIRLEAYISHGEQARKKVGKEALAKAMAERASKDLAGLRSSFPSLGENDRPETPRQLRDLLSRIQKLRLGVNLPPLNVDLTPRKAVGADESK